MFKTIRWGFIGLLWTGYLALAFFLSQNGRFGLVDFRVYFNSAGMLLDGITPYHGLLNYLYPPLLAQLLMPLAAYLSMESAWLLWFVVNVALIFATIYLLSRYAPPAQCWLLWLIPVIYWPFLEALVVGQVTIILMALFAFAWAAVKGNRPALAGALLAFAAWLKLYPILFIVYFLWKRNWRLVISAAIWGIILAVVQIAISGAEPFTDMMGVLFTLSSEGQTYLASANASVFGFTSQLFEQHEVVQPLVVSQTAYLISRIGLTLGILGATLYTVSRPTHDVACSQDSTFDLEYALILIIALLLSPTLWVSGMPPLALVYFLLWKSRPRGQAGRLTAWFCLVACIVTTLYYVYIIGYTPDPPQSGLVLSFGFYTILATWGLIIYLLRSRTFQTTSAVQHGMRTL